MHRLMPHRSERDRGAVATIVGILIAGGVLIGMTAMVVDVGQLYGEREELQSGADSAARAVAIDCAKHRSTCLTYDTTAGLAADANARDGVTDVQEVCGYDASGRLPACVSGKVGNLTDCLGTPPPGVNYVQVRTRTESKKGDYILPYTFARALTGMGDGATVGACARVAYGPPKAGFAATVSSCEYDLMMETAHTVPPPPWSPAPAASDEVAIGLHGDVAATCGGVPPSGWDQPGDFGWLDENGGACQFLLQADLTYTGDPGSDVSKTCKEVLAELRDSHRVVAMPLFDGFVDGGAGSKDRYRLDHLVGFVVTGYNLPGIHAASNVNPSFDPCGGSDKCIYGYFVDVEFLPGDVGVDNGTDPGLIAVQTIG